MARGWESKAVEEQQQEAERRALEETSAPQDDSPAARTCRERLASLQLSRSRTLEQLERATNPAHREMLHRSLRALETEMEELN